MRKESASWVLSGWEYCIDTVLVIGICGTMIHQKTMDRQMKR